MKHKNRILNKIESAQLKLMEVIDLIEEQNDDIIQAGYYLHTTQNAIDLLSSVHSNIEITEP